MPPSKVFPPSNEERKRKPSVQPTPQTFSPAPAQPLLQRDDIDIARMNPDQVLSLQRSIGNQAVQRMIHSSRSASITSQPSSVVQRKKEKITDIGDRPEEEEGGEFEEEADRISNNKEIRKEVGLRKRLGWSVALHGAKVGDWVMNRFRRKKKRSLFNKVGSGAVDTFHKARDRVYEKNKLKGLSESEQEEYQNEELEWRLEQQKNEGEESGTVNF